MATNAPTPAKGSMENTQKQVHNRYTSADNIKAMTDSLNTLRKEETLTDVVLRTSGLAIPCHRAILASTSEYFNKMLTSGFKEAESSEIELSSVEPSTLSSVVDYIYGQNVVIDTDNVHGLYRAGHMMQIKGLSKITKEFMLTNFQDCCKHPSFLDLPLPDLVECISTSDLEVRNENEVFRAVMRWIKHDFKSREEFTSSLMEHVRLPYCSKFYFCNTVQNEELVSKHCSDLLKKAVTFHMMPSSRPTDVDDYIEPREGSRTVVFQQNKFVKYLYKESGQILSSTRTLDSDYILQSLGYVQHFDKRLVSDYSVCASETNIVYSGGEYSDRKASTTCWSLDTLTGTWLQLPNLNIARYGHSSVSVLGTVFVLGGIGTDSSTSIEMLEPFSNEWCTLSTNIPQAYYCLDVSNVDANKNYILINGNQITYLFDRNESTWITLDKPSSCKCLYKFVDAKLLAFSKDMLQTEYYWFNFEDNTWRSAGHIQKHCDEVNEKSKICTWKGNLIFTYPAGLAIFNPDTGVLKHFVGKTVKNYEQLNNIFLLYIAD